jgi:ABC-2 type transport system permease protein
MTAAGVILFNISWGNYGYLFILVAVTCFWCASFFALLNSFFKNKNQAGAFTGPIILVFSIFGGSMMPLNQFPKSMQWISYFTVNRWFNDGAQKIGNHLFPTASIAILLVSGLILFVVAIFSLKRRITV